MNYTDRRNVLAGISGVLVSVLFGNRAKAQFTEQEVTNGLQVTSTGDVDVNQSASGSQIVDVNGVPVTGDGIYSTSTGQVIVNDGQVTSTGDVSINQSASGTQDVTGVYSGMVAETCDPGHVIADPTTGRLFFQAADCCYYEACARKCPETCQSC